eukprot:TRINITY_DN39075_c0_g1_i1.p1 TRINITY_DN39075_c0_g1~~TRINITY_DN39075_c0_g1_i1.p1  ORF type:complete len:237 (+),score=21.61 TRINITY_DN39075_c0_g1_i1:40-750(+)
MIIKVISDGVTLGDREVVAVNPKKPFGAVVSLVLKKLGMSSMEGYGLWLCEGCSPPLPVVPVDRRDVPWKLGVVQGSILYVRKETAKERRATIKECAELARLKESDQEAYRTQHRIMRQVEATRQRTARRIHAMNLLGTEWTLLDPSTLPEDHTCTICLQQLSAASSDPVSLTSCAHNFHETCLMAWIGKGTGRGSEKCPVCRKHINKNSSESDTDSDSSSEPDLPPVIWRARRIS